MNDNTRKAKSIKWYIVLPFEGEIRVLDNEVSVWTDYENERINVSTRVFKSDTVQEVQDRLITDWEEKKEQVDRDNAEWEDPSQTQGHIGDSLTL